MNLNAKLPTERTYSLTKKEKRNNVREVLRGNIRNSRMRRERKETTKESEKGRGRNRGRKGGGRESR